MLLLCAGTDVRVGNALQAAEVPKRARTRNARATDSPERDASENLVPEPQVSAGKNVLRVETLFVLCDCVILWSFVCLLGLRKRMW